MEEQKSIFKTKGVVTAIVSIFIFTILVFAAGYAYFTVGSSSMASSQINVGMPSRTTLSCSGTPTSSCYISVTYASMIQSANSNTTAKNSVDCYLNCTCSGSSGGKCNYNINVQAVTAYTPSSAVGSGKEFTMTAVLGTGCTAPGTANTTHQTAASEIQVNTVASKIFGICNLTAGQTSNTKVTYKWYNFNGNQDSQAGKTFAYKINSLGAVLT